jgi:hypothetical protein
MSIDGIGLSAAAGYQELKSGFTAGKNETLSPTPDRVSLSKKKKADAPPTMAQMQKLCKAGGENFSNAASRVKAQQLLDKKKDGTKEETVINNDKHIHVITHGVPSMVNAFDHRGVTFRHYFADAEQKQKALDGKALIGGPVSYAQVGGGIRNDFPELKGVFLTMPDVDPGLVGVPGRSDYADLQLPADTGVLEIEPGRIYLIPSEIKRPDWIVDYYTKWKTGQEVPSYMLDTLKGIEKEGGLKEPEKVFFSAMK